ncbi:hypothetical protein V3C99_014298 [Haemonchus contortus]
MLIPIAIACLALLTPSWAAASHCPSDNGMTDDIRAVFVDQHNYYRSLIANGQAKNKNGGFAPKAARMLKVSYDCDVEVNAVGWLKSCTFGNNNVANKNQWGTNVHTLSLTANNTEAAIESVKAWFNELYNIGVPQNNMFTPELYQQGLGEYAQLAWQSSNKIGCAVTTCSNSYTAVACEYNPGGDTVFTTIYDIGDPCTIDDDCQCAGCVCSKDEALCIPPSTKVTTHKPTTTTVRTTTKPTTTTTTTTTEPTTTTEKPEYIVCPNDNGMTDEVRWMFVNTHNKLRSRTAQGKSKNAPRFGGFAPKAARMLKVSYDCAMEANMMKWAKQCHFYHPPPAYRNYWGQNIYMMGDPYYNFTWPSIAETAVISWWQELQVFGVPENNIVVAPDEHKTGHYMQVVWQWTYKIGCAINYCTKNKPWPWTIAGCNYYPSGDNAYWVVYEMGDPCTTDADCKCADCICSKDEALCIPPQYVPLPPTTTSTTTPKPTTTTTVPPLNAGSCPGLNNGMTDEVRKTFVDKHNEYRSLIAKGQAKDKVGQFAPKAARMLKVNYDCEVEENAMEWAKSCTFGLNTAAMLKRWGNNMQMLSPKTNNKTEAAIASVDAWFGQLQKSGVPEKNVFTMNNYMSLSKYSQLAWQSSNRIGCVVVPCWNSWTVVVCEYNPGGDLPGEVIYDEGDPCTEDSHCQCPGCVCSRDEALCIAP